MQEPLVTIAHHTGKAQTEILQAPRNRHVFSEDQKGIVHWVRCQDSHIQAPAEVLQAKLSLFWRGGNQLSSPEVPSIKDNESSCTEPFAPLPSGSSTSQNITEYHRIVGVGRDLCGSSTPTPLLK